MSETLLVSNVALWLAVVVLGVIVVALTRQIGLLHERLGPVGGLAHRAGLAVGDAAPRMQLTDLSGREIPIGAPSDGERTLLFFLSPTCPICDTLLPTLLRVAAAEQPGLRLVVASDGEPDRQRRFRAEHGLDGVPYVLSTELGMRFGVARLPTAVLIDAGGIVRANAMVNTREHLESLFLAEEMGVASLQEFVERDRPAVRALS